MGDTETGSPGAGRVLILISIFLTGAAVMVVEILGVRLISPTFGTGMHVWASLISVALVAIAVGYFAGGWFADRYPRPGVFFTLVAAGGVGVLAIPVYAPALIPAFEAAGYRLGALLAALSTFLPPLFLLGCATPFAVRLGTRSVERAGSAAGRAYAVSTLGSVAGTLLTGFALAPALEINDTLRIVGAVVVVPGVVGLLGVARVRSAVILLVLSVVAGLLPEAEGSTPFGTSLLREDSAYQRVEVVERNGERVLFLDGCVHTRMTVAGEGPVHPGYAKLFDMLSAYAKSPRNLLVLGLGGGAILDLIGGDAEDVTVVEYDPIVIRAARQCFGTITGSEEIRIEDARTFVRRTGKTWDMIALDVCGVDLMPEHLVTVEFFREIERILAPDGVLAVNSIGANDGPVIASIHATICDVFPRVKALATNPEGPFTNVVFFASRRALEASSSIMDDEEKRFLVRPGKGEVLTDQKCPVNFWNAGWAREIRRNRREVY